MHCGRGGSTVHVFSFDLMKCWSYWGEQQKIVYICPMKGDIHVCPMKGTYKEYDYAISMFVLWIGTLKE
jgi:hypothetical protein